MELLSAEKRGFDAYGVTAAQSPKGQRSAANSIALGSGNSGYSRASSPRRAGTSDKPESLLFRYPSLVMFLVNGPATIDAKCVVVESKMW